MVRILHIVDNLSISNGVSSALMNWYRNINKEKYQFDFLVCQKRNKTYEEEIKQLGGNVYYLLEKEKLAKYIILINRVKKFFKQHKGNYNIVHLHSPTLVGIMFYYAKKYGIKHRIIHSHSSSYANSKIKNYRNKILLKPINILSTDYATCSHDAGLFLFPKKRFTILKNGIDFKKFSFNTEKRNIIRKEWNLDEKTLVIGHISNMSDLKRVDLVIKMINELKKSYKNIKLVLCGRKEIPNKIKKIIEDYNLNDLILNVGISNDIPSIMSAMDICYMPSEKEGLGLVAVECQANGLPVYVSKGFPKDVYVSNYIFTINNNNDYSDFINLKSKGHANVDLSRAKELFDIKVIAKEIEKYYDTINKGE